MGGGGAAGWVGCRHGCVSLRGEDLTLRGFVKLELKPYTLVFL